MATATTVPASPTGSSPVGRAVQAYATIAEFIDKLQPLFGLALRFYVAEVFFRSGLIKLSSWTSTVALFANEYHVPVLPPYLAAVLGTAAEIGLPILLILGLGTRFTAVAMFVFNIVAATSYPDLSPAGLKDHILWGTLLMVTFFYGPGKIAVDEWLKRRYA